MKNLKEFGALVLVASFAVTPAFASADVIDTTAVVAFLLTIPAAVALIAAAKYGITAAITGMRIVLKAIR